MQIFVLEYSAEEAYAPFYGNNKIYINFWSRDILCTEWIQYKQEMKLCWTVRMFKTIKQIS